MLQDEADCFVRLVKVSYTHEYNKKKKKTNNVKDVIDIYLKIKGKIGR